MKTYFWYAAKIERSISSNIQALHGGKNFDLYWINPSDFPGTFSDSRLYTIKRGIILVKTIILGLLILSVLLNMHIYYSSYWLAQRKH